MKRLLLNGYFQRPRLYRGALCGLRSGLPAGFAAAVFFGFVLLLILEAVPVNIERLNPEPMAAFFVTIVAGLTGSAMAGGLLGGLLIDSRLERYADRIGAVSGCFLGMFYPGVAWLTDASPTTAFMLGLGGLLGLVTGAIAGRQYLQYLHQ